MLLDPMDRTFIAEGVPSGGPGKQLSGDEIGGWLLTAKPGRTRLVTRHPASRRP
jgi:hypothetical protein